MSKKTNRQLDKEMDTYFGNNSPSGFLLSISYCEFLDDWFASKAFKDYNESDRHKTNGNYTIVKYRFFLDYKKRTKYQLSNNLTENF